MTLDLVQIGSCKKPKNTPRVLFEEADTPPELKEPEKLMFPKSVALPAEPNVIKSITFDLLPKPSVAPPKKQPLVVLFIPFPQEPLATVKSPKSVPFPVEAIVIYSIILLALPDKYPPDVSPLVALENVPRAVELCVWFPKVPVSPPVCLSIYCVP